MMHICGPTVLTLAASGTPPRWIEWHGRNWGTGVSARDGMQLGIFILFFLRVYCFHVFGVAHVTKPGPGGLNYIKIELQVTSDQPRKLMV